MRIIPTDNGGGSAVVVVTTVELLVAVVELGAASSSGSGPLEHAARSNAHAIVVPATATERMVHLRRRPDSTARLGCATPTNDDTLRLREKGPPGGATPLRTQTGSPIQYGDQSPFGVPLSGFTSTTHSKQFFTVKELSEYMNVKPKTIYSWVAKNVLPFYQFEVAIRFKKSEIDTWIKNHKKT